jgi:2',3'-cyclic-nucleotide 2'-phosphodiesterase
MKILFIGDIVGKPGRDAALTHVPILRNEFAVDLVVANAENVAGGWGITPPLARMLLSGGMDVLTLGNHTYAKPEGADVLTEDTRVLRPANYPPGAPGRGWGLYRTKCGALVGVANLNGRTFMEPLDDPFRMADEIIAHLSQKAKVLLFDFHAETTSEKVAFGWHCDGRVSAVIGTHTHIPTADERVLPGGTAYITDVGMCGPEDSVIGMDTESVLQRFRTQLPCRFKVAEGRAVLNAVLIDVDEETGKGREIQRIARRD